MVAPSAGPVTTGGSGATVSTVNVTGSDAGETFPTASICVADTVCGPSPSGVVGSSVQVPSGATVAVPTTTPSTVTVTVAPGSPVPVIVGVLSAVISPSVGEVTTGASGAVASTVNVLVGDAGDVLPAASVCVADTVCSPSASGSVSARLQVPSGCTVVVPTTAPSTVTSTVAPGSPVPVTVGVVSEIVDPFAGLSTTGASGAAVSTVNVTVSDAGDVLPAGSVCVAVTVWSPSASGVVTSRLQVPSGATVVVPTTVPSMVTSTVAPGSPVPVIVGVESAVTSPSAGDVTTGGAGGGGVGGEGPRGGAGGEGGGGGGGRGGGGGGRAGRGAGGGGGAGGPARAAGPGAARPGARWVR